MRYVKRRNTLWRAAPRLIPPTRYISFHICKSRSDSSWKVIPQESERETAPPSSALFLSETMAAAIGLNRIGPFPSPAILFLRLRFANSSLIFRKSIAWTSNSEHEREKFQNTAYVRCYRMIYENVPFWDVLTLSDKCSMKAQDHRRERFNFLRINYLSLINK